MTLTPCEELGRFAYGASHDLRAPLRGIRTLVSFLAQDLEPVLSGETREMTELIEARVARMEALLDGPVACARAGRIRSDPEPVDISRLVEEIFEPHGGTARQRLASARGLPTVESDRAALGSVLECLLSNAVRFGGDAPIGVARERSGDAWRFEVRDAGDGFAPEPAPLAFEPLRTLQPRDDVDGSGPGLAVAKRMVEARGGTVGLESVPGEGTTAGFTWPDVPAAVPGSEEEDAT